MAGRCRFVDGGFDVNQLEEIRNVVTDSAQAGATQFAEPRAMGCGARVFFGMAIQAIK